MNTIKCVTAVTILSLALAHGHRCKADEAERKVLEKLQNRASIHYDDKAPKIQHFRTPT
jgi:hypothetical protein